MGETKKGKCSSCGGDLSAQPQESIQFLCKCGLKVDVHISTSEQMRGVRVTHNAFDPNGYNVSNAKKNTIQTVSCPYITIVPHTVWCPTCQVNRVPQWEKLCVSVALDREEARMMQYLPIVRYYRQKAKDLVSAYGPLQSVECLSYVSNFEFKFVFENGTVCSGQGQRENDINFLSIGDVREGTRNVKHFLEELGFLMSPNEIKAIQQGAVIELYEGKVVVSYPEK